MNEIRREIACCFSGHRAEKLPWRYNEDAPECIALKALIADMLDEACAAGFRRFYCGMASGADLYCGEAVVALRGRYPDVTLEAVIPFRGQERRWPRKQRERYARLAERCDAVTVLHETYRPGCMQERNRYMVDRSSLLIAVYDGLPGGTFNTVRYAEKRRLTVVVVPVSGLVRRGQSADAEPAGDP